LIWGLTVQSSPQALPFVEDQELAGGIRIEYFYCVCKRSFLAEELGGSGSRRDASDSPSSMALLNGKRRQKSPERRVTAFAIEEKNFALGRA